MSRHQHGYPWPSPATLLYRPSSSSLHPVSAQSCCMKVLAGRPAFDRPRDGVHRSTFNTLNSMVCSDYFYLIIVICLHTFIWFQVTWQALDNNWPPNTIFELKQLPVIWYQIFVSNNNNFQTPNLTPEGLYHSGYECNGNKEVLLCPQLEPRHQMLFIIILTTF